MKAVAFTPTAETDLGAIWDYTAHRWGPDQADIYTDAIRDVCHELASGTKQGRPVEVWPDFKKYLCGSHVVYFFEDASRLNVIRILHQRQDVERHL